MCFTALKPPFRYLYEKKLPDSTDDFPVYSQ
jgi:hypothetical protein